MDKSIFSKHHKQFPDGWHVRSYAGKRSTKLAAQTEHCVYQGVNKVMSFHSLLEAQAYARGREIAEQMYDFFLYRMGVPS